MLKQDLVLIILLINILGFWIMRYDKKLAQRRRRRVPEARLFLIAFLGGATGALAGMRVYHHKTKHTKFVYGIPMLVLLNLVVFYFIYQLVL